MMSAARVAPGEAKAHSRGEQRGTWPFMVALLALCSCDPFHTSFEDNEDAVYYRAHTLSDAEESPSELLVMNWNIKFGGARIDFFFDCFGDRVLMSEDEVVENLKGLVRKIRQVDPDVLFLQEVDVNAKRSAFVDQLQWLLDHTDLNYGVYASQWKADFVPSDGLGAMDDGNAILSRWPLKDAHRIALPLRSDQDALTRYFYLQRNVLSARVELGDRELGLVAVHTDAYGSDGTKRKHIERFKDETDAFVADGLVVVGGGDLNTLPPGSDKLSDFPDTVCTNEDFIADDYTAEQDWLKPLYAKYEPAIPLADYQADNARYFSHTVDGRGFWNRKLDYLFTNAAWQPGSGLVHQDKAHGGMETMPLSDHAPLSAILELP